VPKSVVRVMMLEVINGDELQKCFQKRASFYSRNDKEFSSAKNYC